MKLLLAIAKSVCAGVAVATLVTAVWMLITGKPPNTLTMYAAAEVVGIVWGIVEYVRFRRKWRNVLKSYDLPSFGETPGRPPADDE